jgi:hypothetical protein
LTGKISQDQFVELMRCVARAWGEQDTSTAVSCFTPDAVYMQPPDVQLFANHQQLTAYFSALPPGMHLDFHHIWFNPVEQRGCVEFTFRRERAETADHGTIVIELSGGLIAVWREYVQRGPASFGDFTAVHGKQWRWHIGNYP